MRQQERHVGYDHLDVPAEHVGHGRADAAIGDMHEFELGLGLEQLARQMRDRAGPRRAEIDLAGMGARVGDEVREGVDPERRVHGQDFRNAHDEREERKSFCQSNGILLTMKGMADNAAAPARQIV